MSTETAAPPQLRPPPPKWLLYVLLGGVGAITILGFVVGALWSKLIDDHPLLMISLSSRYRYLMATASEIDALPQIAIGTARNLASDPLYYLLGWYYGDAAIGWLRRLMGDANQVIDATQRWFQKLSLVFVFLTPSPFVCVLAGATRMPARRFWPVNIVGTLTVVTAVRLLADVLEGPLDAFLSFNSRNSRWLLILSILFVVFMVANFLFGEKHGPSLREIDRQAREDAAKATESD